MKLIGVLFFFIFCANSLAHNNDFETELYPIYCWLSTKGSGEASVHSMPSRSASKAIRIGDFQVGGASYGSTGTAWCHGFLVEGYEKVSFYRIEVKSKHHIDYLRDCRFVGKEFSSRTQTGKIDARYGDRHFIFRMNDGYTFGSYDGYDLLFFLATEQEASSLNNANQACKDMASKFY